MKLENLSNKNLIESYNKIAEAQGLPFTTIKKLAKQREMILNNIKEYEEKKETLNSEIKYEENHNMVAASVIRDITTTEDNAKKFEDIYEKTSKKIYELNCELDELKTKKINIDIVEILVGDLLEKLLTAKIVNDLKEVIKFVEENDKELEKEK